MQPISTKVSVIIASKSFLISILSQNNNFFAMQSHEIFNTFAELYNIINSKNAKIKKKLIIFSSNTI